MMRDVKDYIGILTIDFHIPEAQSLKDKRMVVKSLKDRIRKEFNVSVSELDALDKWQTGTLGCAMIGNDNRYMNQCLENIISFVGHHNGIQICEHQIEFI